MRTRVPLNVSGLTPELRAAAERAAGKMGLSLEDWMRLMASETGENYGADRERRDQGYDAGGGYQRSEAPRWSGYSRIPGNRMRESVQSAPWSEPRVSRDAYGATALISDLHLRIEDAEKRQSESAETLTATLQSLTERLETSENLKAATDQAMRAAAEAFETTSREQTSAFEALETSVSGLVSRLEETSAQANAALSATNVLSSFEATIADLKERVAASTARSAETDARASDAARALTETLGQTAQRVAAFEERHNGLAAEQNRARGVMESFDQALASLKALAEQGETRSQQHAADVGASLGSINERLAGFEERQAAAARELQKAVDDAAASHARETSAIGERLKELDARYAAAARSMEGGIANVTGRQDGEYRALADRLGVIEERNAETARHLKDSLIKLLQRWEDRGADPTVQALKSQSDEIRSVGAAVQAQANLSRSHDDALKSLESRLAEAEERLTARMREQVDADVTSLKAYTASVEDHARRLQMLEASGAEAMEPLRAALSDSTALVSEQARRLDALEGEIAALKSAPPQAFVSEEAQNRFGAIEHQLQSVVAQLGATQEAGHAGQDQLAAIHARLENAVSRLETLERGQPVIAPVMDAPAAEAPIPEAPVAEVVVEPPPPPPPPPVEEPVIEVAEPAPMSAAAGSATAAERDAAVAEVLGRPDDPPTRKTDDFLAAARRAAQAAAAAEADALTSRGTDKARGVKKASATETPWLRVLLLAGLLAVAGYLAYQFVLKKPPAPNTGPAPVSVTPAPVTPAAGDPTPAPSGAPFDELPPAPTTGVPPAASPEGTPAPEQHSATDAPPLVPVNAPKAEATPTAAPTPAAAEPTAPPKSKIDQLKVDAEAGDARAQFELGLRYAEGEGVKADNKEAAKWMMRAAEAGIPPAQFRMGVMFERGQGVPRDTGQAKSWYQRAANAGNRKAMYNLAVLLSDGSAGKPDYKSAAEWFLAAAELGVKDSQYNIALLYERGLGVEVNLVEAYKWYAAAAAQGDKESGERAIALESRMKPDDVSKAKQMAADFKPKPVNAAANDTPTLKEK